MTTEIDKLIEEYKKYIIQNNITNYYNFNFETIKTNIIKFESFLNDYKEYNNITYLYFKCVYYFCKEKYSIILKLADNIVESNIYTLIGYYYRNIKTNDDLMKKYYLMAIELNNSNAMYNLGNYYECIANYDLMEKYYLMAIELNNTNAMWNLGNYYQYIENYDLMKKYYLMAVELNHSGVMCYLGYYYKYIEINYDLMKKYYNMAIKLNNFSAMNSLGCYYEKIELNYDLTKKYYLMAIEFGDNDAKYYLKHYCKTIEKNKNNYYIYVYYPRILTLVLAFLRYNKAKIKPENGNKHIKQKLFLPEEIYIKIYTDYILKT